MCYTLSADGRGSFKGLKTQGQQEIQSGPMSCLRFLGPGFKQCYETSVLGGVGGAQKRPPDQFAKPLHRNRVGGASR
jgi:hypothetical protein